MRWLRTISITHGLTSVQHVYGLVVNKHPSQHWFALLATLMIPVMIVIINIVTDTSGAKTPSGVTYMTTLNMFYAGVGMWWIFALLSAMPGHPNHTNDTPKYGRWLLLLPVTAIAFAYIAPVDGYDARILWFNSVAVTWVSMVLWILVDWYRWKFNPTVRQLGIQLDRDRADERQAEIDKIPNCIVPSDLTPVQ